MAGCMLFVFAALGEFVVVKVLDVQYQYQLNRNQKIMPMVCINYLNISHIFRFGFFTCIYINAYHI